MIVESAQMLSTVLRSYGYTTSDLYKSAYQKHPCTVWTGQTRGNFQWLCDHALAMCTIYTTIGRKTHASEYVIRGAYNLRNKIPEGDRTEFADCTEFKDFIELPVTKRYQMFMNLKWSTRDKTPPKWTNRKPPEWKMDLK